MGYVEAGEVVGKRLAQLLVLVGGFYLGKKIFKKKEEKVKWNTIQNNNHHKNN